MPSSTILIASSENASNVSSDGSSFDLDLSAPLVFPPGSSPRVALISTNVFFNFPNIGPELSNNLLYYSDNGALPLKWTITLERGLYDLDTINSKMSLAFVANGHPSDLFEFLGDESTGRIYLTKAASTTAFQFTFGPNSAAAVLGFVPSSFPNSPGTAAFTELSPNQAALDVVTLLLVHCSLAAGASYVGPSSGAALASFSQGSTPVGSLISHTPFFPAWVDLPRMSGSSIQRINFWLTDESGRRGSLSTNGEPWSASIVIEW